MRKFSPVVVASLRPDAHAKASDQKAWFWPFVLVWFVPVAGDSDNLVRRLKPNHRPLRYAEFSAGLMS
jgi:hypothetical protein